MNETTSKVCVLFSGHIRKFSEHIGNFKTNILDVLTQNNYKYDVVVYTWDQCNALTPTYVHSHSNHTSPEQCTHDEIMKIFQDGGVSVKQLVVENQKEVGNELGVEEHLSSILEGKTVHTLSDKSYVSKYSTAMFWQYYGQHKSLQLILGNSEYSHVIKTRPDLYYTEPFDINLLDRDLFIPNSHRHSNTSINCMFCGGKISMVAKILGYFSDVIYPAKNQRGDTIINGHHPTDINFNCLNRYYIMDHLKCEPYFCKFNPSIYRDKTNIIHVH